MTERPLLEHVISDLKLDTTVGALENQIKVTPQTNTALIDVAVQNQDRSAARDVADTLVRDFIASVKKIQEQEVQTPNARSADNLVIVAPAVADDRPVSPRTALNVGLGAVVGLLAAMGLAVLRGTLDQSIQSDEELLERVGLTPLGHVGYVTAGNGKFGELVALTRNSPAAEAYKALRTNLVFSAQGNDLKTIVVTSAAPNEGKSRTVANLAVVLASAGKRTLVLDADFRRPSQHRIFGKARSVGVSNLVLEDVSSDGFFTPIEKVPNLYFLASGPVPPNPSELLGSSQVKRLIAGFRQAFDYVIIDSPPVNAVTDPSVLAAEADATILVAEEGRTTYKALAHAKSTLDRVEANILGVVINKIRAHATSYQYYEYGYPSSNGQAGTDVATLEARIERALRQANATAMPAHAQSAGSGIMRFAEPHSPALGNDSPPPDAPAGPSSGSS
jgi:capsular exopolysaccharide synthesis family protein